MKIRSLFVVALSLSALTACGGSYKAPTNDYDKVKTAFNGVEKSFKKITPLKNPSKAYGLEPRMKNIDSGLESIFSVFTPSDIRGDSLDELDYAEPPMIQFRYLKSVFEKVGKGYEFGTKYYDNITGDAYIDFETGFKDESKLAANKYSFNFNLGIDININSDDLINADVSFDITLTQGNDSYNTKWYVNLLLDYDLEQSSPNYTLLMYTENDETDLPYYDRFVYEYDYVKVTDSKIEEWRKFCMHASQRLVKDDRHPTFQDYVDKDGIDYLVDNPKWFREGKFYKTTNLDDRAELILANAMYGDLGLNDNDINADPFLNKEGTQNSVIKDMYRSFSNTYGDEIIYDLVTRDEDRDHGPDGQTIKGLRLMSGDGQEGADNYVIPNIRLSDLFEYGFTDPIENRNVKVSLWYVDDANQQISQLSYNDICSLAFYFAMYDAKESNKLIGPVEFQLGEDFLTAYQRLVERENPSDLNTHCCLIFKDFTHDVEGYADFFYAGTMPELGEGEEFPKELIDFGVPEYTSYSNRLEFYLQKINESSYSLVIYNTSRDDADVYMNQTLPKAGFERIDSNVFGKQISDRSDLLISVNANKEETVMIDAHLEPRQSGGDSSYNSGDYSGDSSASSQEELLIKSLVIVGSFNNWELDSGAINLSGTDNAFSINNLVLLQDYEFKLVANNDWTIHNPGTEYGGFGYDDLVHEDKVDTYLSRLAGPDGNIHVDVPCRCSLKAMVQDNQLKLMFSNFERQ